MALPANKAGLGKKAGGSERALSIFIVRKGLVEWLRRVLNLKNKQNSDTGSR
ncbi:MAG: hypothetical protein ACR2NU_11655 [Aeoliella sp.]